MYTADIRSLDNKGGYQKFNVCQKRTVICLFTRHVMTFDSVAKMNDFGVCAF